jgi:hypothetical protein
MANETGEAFLEVWAILLIGIQGLDCLFHELKCRGDFPYLERCVGSFIGTVTGIGFGQMVLFIIHCLHATSYRGYQGSAI